MTRRSAAFRASLRGELIEPGDAGYDAARKVYNAMIERRPRLIARCADVADVMAAVNFGREQKLLVAIRGGGHNAGGLGVCDDGLVIDLSRMNYVRVDPKKKTVQVGGGRAVARRGSCDACVRHGGAVGIISTTGVAGLTLGGGIGYLARRYGLDDRQSAGGGDGAGRWAIRYGEREGKFGFVLGGARRRRKLWGGDFVFIQGAAGAHRVRRSDALAAGRRGGDDAVVSRLYSEGAGGCLRILCFSTRFRRRPPFPEQFHLQEDVRDRVVLYRADEEGGRTFQADPEIQGRLRWIWPGRLPHPALQSMFDGLYPPGLQWYWKADFVRTLPDEAIAQHVKQAATLPTLQSTMHLYPINGAAGRVKRGATAWWHRDANWTEVIVGVDPDPAKKEEISAWAKEYWNALHPYSSGGAYVNFMMEEGEERIRATYGKNYKRLAKIKRRYDPGNLFRVNQNIRPK